MWSVNNAICVALVYFYTPKLISQPVLYIYKLKAYTSTHTPCLIECNMEIAESPSFNIEGSIQGESSSGASRRVLLIPW